MIDSKRNDGCARWRRGSWLAAGALQGALLLSASVARAQVFQTDTAMTPLPQPVGTAESTLVNQAWAWAAETVSYYDLDGNYSPTMPIVYGQYYAPPAYPQFVTGDAITLAGLFKWRKEAIDPVKDARTAPGAFTPGAMVSAQVVLRGGSCHMDFGWYNVSSLTTPPAASDVHPLISGAPAAITCTEFDGVTPKTDGFCPLAWDNRDPRNLSITDWQVRSFTANILADAAYAGGQIGFALMADPVSSYCPATKYSVATQNQRNSNGVPWVTMLVYRSTLDATGYYLAFEDTNMPAANWKANFGDGDFNDQVFFVSGLTDPVCAGVSCPRGQACVGGACVDPCAGITCLGGALCSGGVCSTGSGGAGGSGGSAGSSAGGAGAGMSDSGGSDNGGADDGGTNADNGGTNAGADNGETSAGGVSTAGSAADGGTEAYPVLVPVPKSGCGCRLYGQRPPPGTSLLALLAALAGSGLARRRRRRSACVPQPRAREHRAGRARR